MLIFFLEFLFMLFKRLGIDLGTANSLVYLAGEGVVLNEPTVVAVSIEDNRVVAVGNEAREMLGRTPGNIIASRPLKDGVIADYALTEAMLRYFLDKVCGRTRFFKPEVMICIPAGCTQVEKRAVMDATLSAGARTVYLIEEPLAAAIGAKIPIAQASGNMIVDTGGGSSEAAVISLGGVVVHNSVRVAGTKLDEAVATYIKKKFNLIIGERMAEDVKIQIGDAMPQKSAVKNPARKMEVRGRDSLTGLPRMIELTSEEVASALNNQLNSIITGIKEVLENTPPELASDIIDKGIVLSGGTALLKNIDKLIMQATGVAVHIAEDPLVCVVKGTGVALENIDLYKRTISKR